MGEKDSNIIFEESEVKKQKWDINCNSLQIVIMYAMKIR